VPAGELASDPSNALIGRVLLGRYRVVRPLARGGMGVVYLGRVEGAAGFAKPVVIKSVLPSFGAETETEQLFAREARIVANLQHPGIVGVIDFGKVDASYVMVLEYIHGYHLGQWQRFVQETRGSVRTEHAVHVVLQVIEALSFAHAVARPDGTTLGVVHRDIAPGNILIDLQGHIKLSDFGIARTDDDEFRTQQGLFRGTLPFSAPEALQGAAPSPKLDQYGVGVVLYQLLSGANPFKEAAGAATITRILTHEPPPITELRDDVSPELDAAIARAISKNPDDRYGSVTEFADAIRAACRFSERGAAESFALQIERDFAGETLAERLGLESLGVRDSSWREAQPESLKRVALSSSPPKLAVDQERLARARATLREDVTARESPVSRVRAKTEPQAPVQPASAPWILALLLGAGAALAGGAYLFAKRPPPEAPKVLVIEKSEANLTPAAAPTALEPAMPAAALESAASGASAAAPVVASRTPAAGANSAAPRAPGAATADRGALLARAFQKQEAKIQSCFREHPTGAETPPLSVRFQVDQSGNVERAQLTPSSVAATPLGPCILALARATQFGPQPEAISFAIPISARVVRR
jgi:serine/threonine-protein kinase